MGSPLSGRCRVPRSGNPQGMSDAGPESGGGDPGEGEGVSGRWPGFARPPASVAGASREQAESPCSPARAGRGMPGQPAGRPRPASAADRSRGADHG